MRVTGDIGVTASQFLDPAWKWRNVVSVALDHLCFPCIYLMDWGWVCPKATWRFELKTSRMIVQCPIQDHHIFITKSRYMYALAIYFLRGPNLHFHYMRKKNYPKFQMVNSLAVNFWLLPVLLHHSCIFSTDGELICNIP